MKFILFLLCTTFSMIIMSEPVGSRFSYQGQLDFNGAPANGIYDLKFEIWSQETAGTVIGSDIILEDTEVNDGIFSVDLDFGDIAFNGDDVFLKIQIREGDSIGNFTQLSPRQRINSVPYAIQADFLSPNSANFGQVLKFNGQDWVPGTDETGSNLWNNDSNGISTSTHVGVGSSSSSSTSFIVSAPSNISPMSISINGQPKLQVAGNGGVGIATNTNVAPPPANGLYVFGETELNQQTTITDELIVQKDAKHSRMDSYGFAKAGIEFSCGNAGSVRLQYFNNINDSEITVSNGSSHGSCSIGLPFDYDDLYYQTTVEFNGTTPITGSCGKGTQGGSTQVTVCRVYNLDTNSSIVVAQKVTLLIF